MADAVADYLGRLLPGAPLQDVVDWIAARSPVQPVTSPQGMSYFLVAEQDVKLFPGDGKQYRPDQIRAIAYGPRFPAAVNGVMMGMTGDQVEQALGSPHRLWPMPHENYVLLYDCPHFFRADLKRETEQVIAMYR